MWTASCFKCSNHVWTEEPLWVTVLSHLQSLLFSALPPNSPSSSPVPWHQTPSLKTYPLLSCCCPGQEPPRASKACPLPSAQCWMLYPQGLCVVPLASRQDDFTLDTPMGNCGPSWMFYAFPLNKMCSFLRPHLIFVCILFFLLISS